MHILKTCFTFFFSLLLATLQAQPVGIIPHPQKLEWKKGVFEFNACTYLQFDSSHKALQWAVAPLKEKLKKAAGLNLANKAACKISTVVRIVLNQSIKEEEGYRLHVGTGKIEITAWQPAGVFYAVQSLLQLLPVAIESSTKVTNVKWQLPAVAIEDAPRFAYRGLMLDVARHYMHIDSVKRFIDLLSRQKSNRFHWHLTDSQGWRFESIKYHKLNTIAAYRKGTPLNTTYDYKSRPNDTLYGGYYTQDQMRDVVQYAAERFITVVPEIEMPAHARAALAAYPELACLDKGGVSFPYPQQVQDEFCTKEETFTFLTGILTEVINIFPSTYIHIAGDEAGKANWKTCPHDQKRMKEEGLKNVNELQSYFVKRIAGFVQSKGRKVIGWDEIMEGGLAAGAAVMSWTGIHNGTRAAQLGHPVVMTPGEFCYFDHYQSKAHGEPIAWGGLTTLAKVYSYNPVPTGLPIAPAKNILGTQGNLWSEFIPTAAKAEYMAFPRAVALAEVAWSQPHRKEYAHFLQRLVPYLQRLDAYGVNYARHLVGLELKDSMNARGTLFLSFQTDRKDLPVYYTLDGSLPTATSAVYKTPIATTKDSEINAAVIWKGHVVAQLKKRYVLHKATGKKATLAYPPSPQYSRGGTGAWHNGSWGSNERFDDEEWLGFNAKPFQATIPFTSAETINSLRTRFFHKPSSWIWAPQKIEVQVSQDGKEFTTIKEEKVPAPFNEGSVVVELAWAPVKAAWMRIVVTPYGIIPKGHAGAGLGAWLFVDEMVVE